MSGSNNYPKEAALPNVDTLATRDQAIARAERIRVGIKSLSELQQDLADAYHARDWATLGYRSWDEYVTGEFGGSLPRLNREERRELVVNLEADGLTTRGIAAAVGTDHATVVRDLKASGGASAPPDGKIGLDGRRYPSRPAETGNSPSVTEPKPKPRKAPRAPSQPVPLTGAQRRAVELAQERNDDGVGVHPNESIAEATGIELTSVRKLLGRQDVIADNNLPDRRMAKDGKSMTAAGFQHKQWAKEAAPGLKTMKRDWLLKMVASVSAYETVWDQVSDIDPNVTPDEAIKLAEDLHRGILALTKFKRALDFRASNRQEQR